jgi:predicted small integral membrane protein
MEFSWTILACVFVANLFWIGVMFLAQQLDRSLPSRHSIIPGTNQKFLHAQDFWTMTYGDLIAVPFINTAFVHLAFNQRVGIWHWLAFLAIAIIAPAIFVKMCLGKDHKPDQGFPDIGKISWHGILHLPYLGIGVASGMLCLWFIFTGDLRGPVLYAGIGGGVFYICCFLGEIFSGNFDPLKKI